MYYVYVLKNGITGLLYKGYTENLIKRIEEHNKQKVKSTKNKGTWQLIYYEAFLNKTDALREEKFLKSGQGRDRLKYLFSLDL